MKNDKYNLNDPIIQWRCKVEKQQTDESYRKMCNHEITHAVLNTIKQMKNRKEDLNAKLVQGSYQGKRKEK